MSVSKSTPISQLPKGQYTADNKDDSSPEDDATIQEVLAEIKAQERNILGNNGGGNVQPQYAPQPQYTAPPQQFPQQNSFPSTFQPTFAPPGPVFPYGASPAQILAGAQALVNEQQPQQTKPTGGFVSQIYQTFRSEMVLFGCIIAAVFLFSTKKMEDILMNNFAYFNVPYIETVLKALAIGVTVILSKWMIATNM
jgi:hypothetical protein